MCYKIVDNGCSKTMINLISHRKLARYGHIYKLAQSVKQGIDSVEGAEGILYQVGFQAAVSHSFGHSWVLNIQARLLFNRSSNKSSCPESYSFAALVCFLIKPDLIL